MSYSSFTQSVLFIVLLHITCSLSAQEMSFAVKYHPYFDQAATLSQSDVDLKGSGCFSEINQGSAIDLELDFIFNRKYSFFVAMGYGQSQLNLSLASTRDFYEAKNDGNFSWVFSTLSNQYFMLKMGGAISKNIGEDKLIRASLGIGCIVPAYKQEDFGEGATDYNQGSVEYYQYYQGRYSVNDPFGPYVLINPSIEYIKKLKRSNWNLVLGLNSLLVPQQFLNGQVVFFGDEENVTIKIDDGLATLGLEIGFRYDFIK